MSLSKFSSTKNLALCFTRNRNSLSFLRTTSQFRSLQTLKKYDPKTKVNFFEGVGGAYSIPNYKLDLTPWNPDDGGSRFWSKDNISLMFLWTLGSCTILYGLLCLIWYTFWDKQVSLRRDDLYPYLQIKSGRDYDKIRVPWLTNNWIRGHTGWELRTLFYYEIEDAIQRRKMIDERLAAKK